jgi:hypothetical protein
VYVNGAAKAFEAYIINGNNYFKLRDLAYVMNGTAKQFEVGYDTATKAITLTTGRAYTPDGGEMASGDGRAKTASPTASRIYLNGKELNLTVYLIGGNNFFKLRDLMEAIDVFVGYDNATKAITLDTSKGYEPEGSAVTPTPTPTPTPSPAPTPTTSGESIIGAWSGAPTLSIDSSRRWIEFNSNGTFTHYVNVTRNDPYYQMYTLITTGNYTASNGVINCTNVKETYNTGRTSNEYENKPVDDCVWHYKFKTEPWGVTTPTENSTWLNPEYVTEYVDVIWLQVNFNPYSSDEVLNTYEDFAIPFDD